MYTSYNIFFFLGGGGGREFDKERSFRKSKVDT